MNPSSATSVAADADQGYKWKAFWAVAITLFTMVMDFSITFLALSTIAEDFGVTLRAVTWVAIASSLTISAVLLPLGRLADITGRKKFHLAGIVLFSTGALLAALSPNLPTLIGARIIMAIGGAMGQAVVMAIVTAVFPSNERGKALGMITTVVAIGGTAGPIVAGPLLQWFGWRSVFLFLFIPTAIGFVLAWRILDDSRIGTTKRKIGERYDWPGAILSASALALIILTISNPFAQPWISPQIIGGVVVSVALFALFVYWELRVPAPMINLQFFRSPVFTWSSATRLLAFVGTSATFFLLPIFIQSFLGYSQMIAGVIMFVGALGMGIAGANSGRLSDRFGYRKFTFIGLSMLIAMSLFFAFMTQSTPIWLLMPALFLNGLGMGIWMAPNMSATLSAVERSSYGSVSAFLNLVRNVGSVAGQAITTAIVTGVMASRGVDVELSELRHSADPSVGDAFLDGWRMAYLVLVGFSIMALVAAALTRERMQKTDHAGAGQPTEAAPAQAD
ncbi:MAG: MFS transporter [Dehalococcoidia bacterium]